MDEFKKAFMRPFQDIHSLVIGCLLNIIPIINFFATGYVFEAGRLSLKKNYHLPKWHNWGHMWVNGLLVFVLGMIWSIPLIIIGWFSAGAALVSAFMNSDYSAVFGAVGIGLTATIILGILTFYVLPSAVLSFIHKGNFSAGFDFNIIFKKAFNVDYFTAWIFAMIVSIVLAFIGSMIPYVSIVLSPAASFIGSMISVTVIGARWAKLK